MSSILDELFLDESTSLVSQSIEINSNEDESFSLQSFIDTTKLSITDWNDKSLIQSSITDALADIRSKIILNQEEFKSIESHVQASIDAQIFQNENPGVFNTDAEGAAMYGVAAASIIESKLSDATKAVANKGKSSIRILRDNRKKQPSDNSFYLIKEFTNPFVNSDNITLPSIETTANSLIENEELRIETYDSINSPLNMVFSKHNKPFGTVLRESRPGSPSKIYFLTISNLSNRKAYNNIDFSRYAAQTPVVVITFNLNGISFSQSVALDFRKMKTDALPKNGAYIMACHVVQNQSDIFIELALRPIHRLNKYVMYISDVHVFTQPQILIGEKIDSANDAEKYFFAPTLSKVSNYFVENGTKFKSPLHPNENIFIELIFTNGNEKYRIATDILSSDKAFIVQQNPDESFDSITWNVVPVYENLKGAFFASLFNQDNSTPVKLDIFLKYFSYRAQHRRKDTRKGVFIDSHKESLELTTKPDTPGDGFLVIHLNEFNNYFTKKNYSQGVILIIAYKSILNELNLVEIKSVALKSFPKSEIPDTERHAHHAPSSSHHEATPTSTIGALLDEATSFPVTQSSLFMGEEEEDMLNDFINANIFSKLFRLKRSKTHPPEDISRRATFNPIPHTSPSSVPIPPHIHTDVYTTSDVNTFSDDEPRHSSEYFVYDPLFNATHPRLAAVLNETRDMFSLAAKTNPSTFIAPQDITSVQFININLITNRNTSLRVPGFSDHYNLDLSLKLNPIANYDINFLERKPDEQAAIMNQWVWVENEAKDSLFIFLRPPYVNSSWQFNGKTKIDMRIVIDGTLYVLRSFVVPLTNGTRPILNAAIVQFQNIYNRCVYFILQDQQLIGIVIKKHIDYIDADTTYPVTMTGPSSSTDAVSYSSFRLFHIDDSETTFYKNRMDAFIHQTKLLKFFDTKDLFIKHITFVFSKGDTLKRYIFEFKEDDESHDVNGDRWTSDALPDHSFEFIYISPISKDDDFIPLSSEESIHEPNTVNLAVTTTDLHDSNSSYQYQSIVLPDYDSILLLELNSSTRVALMMIPDQEQRFNFKLPCILLTKSASPFPSFKPLPNLSVRKSTHILPVRFIQ